MEYIRSLYVFMILKTLMWGFAIAILGQEFHLSFQYLQLINSDVFGWIMIIMSLLAGYNLFKPIQWKNIKNWIIFAFLIFCLFQMTFVSLSYIKNKPVDAAWARNSAEVLAILWMLIRPNIRLKSLKSTVY